MLGVKKYFGLDVYEWSSGNLRCVRRDLGPSTVAAAADKVDDLQPVAILQ